MTRNTLIRSFKHFACFTENPTDMMAVMMKMNLSLLSIFSLLYSRLSLSLSLVLPHLLAPLRNLCLCHLWHQPAHWHLCQAWQPKPRRSAWLSSIDSFRQLHPDSDLYGGSLIYPRPLCCLSYEFPVVCLLTFGI